MLAFHNQNQHIDSQHLTKFAGQFMLMLGI